MDFGRLGGSWGILEAILAPRPNMTPYKRPPEKIKSPHLEAKIDQKNCSQNGSRSITSVSKPMSKGCPIGFKLARGGAKKSIITDKGGTPRRERKGLAPSLKVQNLSTNHPGGNVKD